MTRQRKRTVDGSVGSVGSVGEVAGHWARFRLDRCPRSRDWLIEQYCPLVALTLKRMLPTVPRAIDPEDLLSEGYLAVVRAVDRFDPGREVKFTSFAIAHIRGALLEWLRKEDWAPRSVRTKQKRLASAELALLERGWEVSALTLAAYLEMDLDEFREFQREAEPWFLVSWDDEFGADEWEDLDPLRWQDRLADPAPGPEAVLLERTRKRALWREVATLPAPYREVFRRYYVDGDTLKVIAQRLERSESRSHQLLAHGLERLRARNLAALGIDG